VSRPNSTKSKPSTGQALQAEAEPKPRAARAAASRPPRGQSGRVGRVRAERLRAGPKRRPPRGASAARKARAVKGSPTVAANAWTRWPRSTIAVRAALPARPWSNAPAAFASAWRDTARATRSAFSFHRTTGIAAAAAALATRATSVRIASAARIADKV